MKRLIQLKRLIPRITLLLVLLSIGTATARAQSVEQHGHSKSLMGIEVHFPFNDANLNLNYMGNAESLDRLEQVIDSIGLHTIDSIVIVSQSSPEGSYKHNMRLSRRRAATMRSIINQRLPHLGDRLHVHSDGEAWKQLRDYVRLDKNMEPNAIEQVLQIIASDTDIATKKLRMKSHPAYEYLLQTYYPRIRNSAFCIIYYDIPLEMAMLDEMVNLGNNSCSDTVLSSVPVLIEPTTPQKAPFYMSLKTNMLYDAMLTPNIGAEFYLGRGFTMAANWMYAWWNNDCATWRWRVYGGDIAIRKWLGSEAKRKPLTGHHVGLYAQALTYDILWGDKGTMAGEPGGTIFDRATLTVGAEYGYSLPIAQRLNLDFTLGAGYMWGKYYEYIPADNCYVWQATKKRRWIGPTKVEVALVWLIGRGNINAEKGGRR